ncbi:MAG: DUF2357 domain-containing protein [Ruminococcaceae bacterium]|nr:DUF2357 domain-containing protein [Oscillospiraceae bacterium]
MEQMERYYRAYAELRKSLEAIDSHRYMTAAQTLADAGEDSHIGKVYYRVVDLDWVEAIESTLMYIDKAIREQRRFIEVTEEVVPIEKARGITTESVRHLAQHTNLIARVEGSDVTPERILNIQREESFAIYENRFLYTLLQKLAYFVGLRYKALSDAPNDSFSKVQLHRDFQVFDEKVEYDLSFAIESHTNTKVDLNADVTTLSGYERVLRIRTILGDFLSTPLMRELTGCEPVRPPILHTNLMTKNPNFKKSLDLWNYIETYTKPGYQAAGNEFDGKLADNFKNALYDTVVMQQFAIELCSNPDLEEQLREEYEEEKLREEQERKAAEEEKFRLYEQKAELAVLEERNALREQIEQFDKVLAGHKKEIADLTVDNENKERKIQRLTSEVKHLEKEVSDRDTKILNMQLELDRKASELEAAKAEAAKFKEKFQESEAKVAELEAKLPALEEKITALETELAAATATIAALTADVAAKKADIEAKTAEIASLGEQVAQLQADITAKADQIAALEQTIITHEATIEQLHADIAAKVQLLADKDSELAQQAERIGTLQADVADKANTITALQSDISSKQAQIAGQETELADRAQQLSQKAEQITALESDIAAKAADIAAKEQAIAERNNTIAARESDIAALNQNMEAAAAAHTAALADQKAALAKEQEKAVADARKEELAVYKKKLAQMRASSKSTVAAAAAAAESAAKAKALSYKHIKELDNGLTVDSFRDLVKTACAIQKGAPSGNVTVMVDDFTADTAALADKYGLALLTLGAGSGKFDKSAAPIDALQAMQPALERGDTVYYCASSEKRTGAMATATLAAREADAAITAVDTEALTGSAIARAVGIQMLAQAGESAEALCSKNLSAVTYLGQDALGMIIKGRFKKSAKTDAVNLPLALDYVFGDCDKRFAFVLYTGYGEEEIRELTDSLLAENEFDQVIAEPTADVKIKALGARSATIFYFD